jgi:hypothetical protein
MRGHRLSVSPDHPPSASSRLGRTARRRHRHGDRAFHLLNFFVPLRTNLRPPTIIGPANPGGATPGVTVLPTSELDCFCLDLYATGGCSITGAICNQKLRPHVDGIDIVELAPADLEKSIECYALVALNEGILPSVGDSISSLAFGLMSLPGGMGDLQVSRRPT